MARTHPLPIFLDGKGVSAADQAPGLRPGSQLLGDILSQVLATHRDGRDGKVTASKTVTRWGTQMPNQLHQQFLNEK